jgi:zinc transport system substrate-binding protein
MDKPFFKIIPILIASFFLSAFSDSAFSAQKPIVFVSVAPQAFFVKRLAGDLVDVRIMVPAGQSPATYAPTPKQMVALSQAKLYFRTGVPFEEHLLRKIKQSFSDLMIIDTRKGVASLPLSVHHTKNHQGAEPDPHIWLDPIRAQIQVMTISRYLTDLFPDHIPALLENRDRLLSDLHQTDGQVRSILAQCEGKSIWVFHPSYGYFADAYGLVQVAVEYQGKRPASKQLALFIDSARADHIRVIFIQPQYSKAEAGAIAKAVGASVVALDPISEDYLNNLLFMAKTIRDSFEGCDIE